MNIETLKEAILNPTPFGLVGTLGYFAATELCSHVRLCRLDYDASDYSRENALAWSLARGERLEKDWQYEITNIEIKNCSSEELKEFLKNSAQSVKNSEYITENPELPISETDMALIENPCRVENFNAFHYGPTYIWLWESKNRFWFLEVHWES